MGALIYHLTAATATVKKEPTVFICFFFRDKKVSQSVFTSF
jgi:hypothetical protein